VNFVADENVDRQIVDRLRNDGHRVWSVAEMDAGTDDAAVLTFANQAGALLLTADRDFGELVFRQRRVSSGVILIRLAGLSPDFKAELIATAIEQHAQALPQAFAVVAPGSIRIRSQEI
jgi:predicted nuclease of predicted toxin-antitoxin system